MGNISSKWQKVILWVTAYLNIIAFVIAGGYTYIKTNDENVKKTAKKVFFITLIFTGVELICTFLRNFADLISANRDFYSFLRIFALLIALAKIVLFATYTLIEVLKKEQNKTYPDAEIVEEK